MHFQEVGTVPRRGQSVSFYRVVLQVGGVQEAAVALVPVLWGACLSMASPQPPSCSVIVVSWLMALDLSVPCLPPGMWMRNGGVGRWSKVGPALGISWKMGHWKRQPWSWAMAGSALRLRQRKQTGRRTGCLCCRVSLTWQNFYSPSYSLMLSLFSF